MRGQEQIIAMRRSGKRPGIVFLNDYVCKTDWAEFAEYATVQITPSEPIGSLDLRFLVGLTVSITGSTEERAKSLFDACKLAGAATVASCGPAAANDHYAEKSWTQIWRKTAEEQT